ncbi:hypothetical protein HPB50_028732 [Hyalomma asiaticum]|nr:hypothetical protein HPB50_028732 [Hyalomma asiaticum]
MGGCWCCVEGCNNKARKTKGVCYHKFPANSALRDKWLFVLRRVNWSPSKNACVCSDHFTPDSYKESVYLREQFGLSTPNYRRLLKSDAVPTVFVHGEHSPLLPDAPTKRRRREVYEQLIQEPPNVTEQFDLALEGSVESGPSSQATTGIAWTDEAASDTSTAPQHRRNIGVSFIYLGSCAMATQPLFKNPSVGIQASPVLMQERAVQTTNMQFDHVEKRCVGTQASPVLVQDIAVQTCDIPTDDSELHQELRHRCSTPKPNVHAPPLNENWMDSLSDYLYGCDESDTDEEDYANESSYVCDELEDDNSYAETRIAALHYNENSSKPTMKDADGVERISQRFSRGEKEWTMVLVKEKSSYNYMSALINNVMDCIEKWPSFTAAEEASARRRHDTLFAK